MDDLKTTIETLLKTYTNSANDPTIKKCLNDFKASLTNVETKNKIRELVPSVIPSLISSIGLSETATETSLILIKNILSNNLLDDNIFNTIEDVLDKVCSLFPFFKDNSNIFSEAVDCLLALPDKNFKNLCIKHYTTIHKRLIFSLNKTDENLMILKVMLKLAKCYENNKPLLIDHFEQDGSVLLKLIYLLFGNDKECRKYVIDIIMSVTSRDVSFTTVTTAHIVSLKHGLMESYVKVMNSLYKNNDDDWAQVWCCVIRLLGVELHRGGPTYVNVLLEILEEAFKSPANNIRLLAFQCWQELIYNFALDTLELCSRKRMKLLLIPLKANNCKVERVAIEKFKTWWLLIRKIQLHIHMFIGDALITFLNFCFLPLDFVGSGTKKEESLSHGRRFPIVAPYVVYALLEVIGHKSPTCTCIQTDEEKLIKPLISPEIFVACSHIIVNAIKEASALLIVVPKFSVVQQQKIVECLWTSLVRITDKSRKAINHEIITVATSLFDFYLSKEADHLASIILEEIILSHQQLLLHTENKIVFTQNMADKKKLIFSIQKESVLKNLFKIIFDCCYDCEEIIKNIFFNVEFLSTIEDHQLLCNFWIMLGTFLMTIIESKQIIFFGDYLKTPVQLLVKNSSSTEQITTWCRTYIKIFNDLTFPQETLVDLCIFLEHIQNENDVATPANGVLIGQVLNCCVPKLKVMSVPNMCVEKILKILTNLIPYQTLNNDCMVFNTLSKMLKMFYINYGVISQICKALPSFLKMNITVNNVNSQADLLDILGAIDEIVTKVNTDNFLLNLILNSLKNIDKSNDKEVSTLVNALTKKCKQKLKSASEDENESAHIKNPNTSTPINEQNQREEILGHDIDSMTPIAKRSSILNRMITKNETKTTNNKTDDFFVVPSTWKFDPSKISEKQKEKMKERGGDIPALYEDLSQSNSQDFFKSPVKDPIISNVKDKENTTTTKMNLAFTTELNVPISNLMPSNKSTENTNLKNEMKQNKKNPRVKRHVRIRKNIPHVTGDSDFDNAVDVPLISTTKSSPEVTTTKSSAEMTTTKSSAEMATTKSSPETATTKSSTEMTTTKDNSEIITTKSNSEDKQVTKIVDKESSETINTKEVNDTDSVDRRQDANQQQQFDQQQVVEVVIEKLDNCPQENIQEVATNIEPTTLSKEGTKESLENNEFTNTTDNVETSQQSDKQSNILVENRLPVVEEVKSNATDITNTDSQQDILEHKNMNESQQTDTIDNSQRGKIQTRRRSSPTPQLTKTEREMKKLKIDCSLDFTISDDTNDDKPKRKLRTRKTKLLDDIYDGIRTRKTANFSLATFHKENLKTKGKRNRRTSADEEPAKESIESQEFIESSQECLAVSKIKISKRISRINSNNSLTNTTNTDNNQNTRVMEESVTYDTLPIETNAQSDSPEKSTTEDDKEPGYSKIINELPVEKMKTNDERMEIHPNTDVAPQNIQGNDFTENSSQNTVLSNCTEMETEPILNEDSIQTNLKQDIKHNESIPSTTEALLLKDSHGISEKDSIYDKDTESITGDFQVSQIVDKSQDRNVSIVDYKDTDSSVVTTGILSSPTKNEELTKEFLNNTIDISPIRVEDKQTITEQSTQSHESSLSESSDLSSETFRNNSSEKLFNEEMQENTNTIQDQQTSSESTIVPSKSPKKRLRGRTRSAQLLELIPNVKPIDVIDSENTIQSYMSTNKHTNIEPEKVIVSDILKFEKVLPSPLAKPSTGIIKGVKRKQSPVQDCSDSPKSKRKRVSFHDPPVSSEKRYVPENCGNVQVSKIRRVSFRKSQKSLVDLFKAKFLLSNKNSTSKGVTTEKSNKKSSPKTNQIKEGEHSEQTKSINNFTTIDPKDSLYTSPIKADITNEMSHESSPDREEDPVPIDVQEITDTIPSQTSPNTTNPFYQRLSTCQNSVDHIIYDLTSPLWISSLRETLNERNIKTVGDFASLSESEINSLPVKEDKIENSRYVLDQYLQRLERENNINLSESLSHKNEMKDGGPSSSTKRCRRYSAPAYLENQTDVSFESKVEQLEGIFGSCNPDETSQLLRRIVSIIGSKNSETLINAVGDQLDYRHLIKDGDQDQFIKGALKYVGLNNGLHACLDYTVSVFGNDLTYWKCIEILKNLTGIDYSIADSNSPETSILNETETYINKISPKIDSLCNKLSSLKKHVVSTPRTADNDVNESLDCNLTNIKEQLKRLPRNELFDLMKEIFSD